VSTLTTTGPKQLLNTPAKIRVSRQSREEIVATLQRLKDDIAARFSVSRIGINGAVARGEQTEASDIDILVGFFAFLELKEYLSLHPGAPVDLVTSDALKPAIRERVAAEVAYA
jgi:predicted nucleotidyltransferase